MFDFLCLVLPVLFFFCFSGWNNIILIVALGLLTVMYCASKAEEDKEAVREGASKEGESRRLQRGALFRHVQVRPLHQYVTSLVHASSSSTSTPLLSPSHVNHLNISRKVFISDARSLLMIATCIAILAVDFNIFPRRQAKTEEYGYSIMDMGVGAFLFVHAAISKIARRASRPCSPVSGSPALSLSLSAFCSSVGSSVLECMPTALPLLCFGSLRLIIHRLIDYHSHVSEYGMHWNFFFTLAAADFLASLLSPFLFAVRRWLHSLPDQGVCKSIRHLSGCTFAAAGLLMACLYQYALLNATLSVNEPDLDLDLGVGVGVGAESTISTQTLPLTRYILQNYDGRHAIINAGDGVGGAGDSVSRTLSWFLHANKEGVYSLIGYLSIYLFAVECGRTLLAKKTGRQWISTCLGFLATAGVLYALVYVCDHYIQTPSRRMANLGYVLWVFAVMMSILASHLLSSLVVFPFPPGLIAPAVSSNYLPFFLVCNVLTGVVNLTIDTLSVGDSAALLVLVVYMATSTGLAVRLYSRKHVFDVHAQAAGSSPSSPPPSVSAQAERVKSD